MENEISQVKEMPTLWKWYFGWHPRLFLTVPIFLLFVCSGIWFIWVEIADVIFFFQNTPVTWGAIFLILLFGSFIFILLMAPIWICFLSVGWLYEICTGDYTAWKKFLYSAGIILLVVLGTPIIRLITLVIFSILD